MNQQRLEKRVRELFERQGFSVEKQGNSFTAEKDSTELRLKAFSSQKFSVEEAVEEAEEGEKIFVDEPLAEVEEELENSVSVLEQDDEEEHDLPSFEVIGSIAVINELVGMTEDEAVKGIRHHQPHVETILLKEEPVQGEYRVGEYRKLYGDETETVHKEFNCRFKVDPTKVYYSERFSTERKRVTDQVQEGEKVLVIGAGVGPYPILAARKKPVEKVVAVEKNPEAVKYLKENLKLNNVEDKVKSLKADAEELELEERFDRIIIPIPESADRFLETGFRHAKDNGVIHLYRFLENQDWNALEQEVEKAAETLNVNYEVIGRVECGDRSPSETRVCLEIKKEGEK